LHTTAELTQHLLQFRRHRAARSTACGGITWRRRGTTSCWITWRRRSLGRHCVRVTWRRAAGGCRIAWRRTTRRSLWRRTGNKGALFQLKNAGVEATNCLSDLLYHMILTYVEIIIGGAVVKGKNN
jgi:hypothetical protein